MLFSSNLLIEKFYICSFVNISFTKKKSLAIKNFFQAFNEISDIAIGHISVTLERNRIVDFTKAIYQVEYGMLSRKPARLGRFRVIMNTIIAPAFFLKNFVP